LHDPSPDTLQATSANRGWSHGIYFLGVKPEDHKSIIENAVIPMFHMNTIPKDDLL
jgi:hypothetical protein